MYDALPFPHITAKDTKEQIKQIIDYLLFFRETLEFILMNISADNLSSDLLNKLNRFDEEIESLKKLEETVIQQVSNKTITASEVIESEEYKASVKELEDKWKEDIQELDDKLMLEIEEVDDKVLSSSEIMDDIIDEMQVDLGTGELKYKE